MDVSFNKRVNVKVLIKLIIFFANFGGNMADNNLIVPNFDDETDINLVMNLEKENQVENCCIISLDGYIDTYNTLFFQNQIQRVVRAGFNKVILDCTALAYIASTGFGALSIILKEVMSKDGDLVIFGLQKKVLDVFHVLGFSNFFKIVNSLDEALDCIKK